MKHLIASLLLATPLVLVPFATQAEVYKWTDAQGRVHFGDKPTDNKVKAQEVEVRDYKPGNDEAVREIYERRDRLRDAGEAGTKDAQSTEAQQRRQADARAELCKTERERLVRISGRVEFYDKQGKPVKVTEQERAERQRKQEAWLREHCP